MTTSGTTAFDLDLNAIAEEAFERCGKEMRTGYDLRTARRSLNLLLLEWANRGVNFWTIDSGTIAMVDGTATYDLPLDTVDVLDVVIRTGSGTTQSDITLSRISSSVYATISNKNTEGEPRQFWVNRLSGATDPSNGVQYPTVTVWPVPDQTGTYTLVYWRMRRMQDVGAAGTTTQDIPFRFLPCLIAGLAFNLSLKLPGAESRTEMLKAHYDEQWLLASYEDRERAVLRITPRMVH